VREGDGGPERSELREPAGRLDDAGATRPRQRSGRSPDRDREERRGRGREPRGGKGPDRSLEQARRGGGRRLYRRRRDVPRPERPEGPQQEGELGVQQGLLESL